MRPARNKILAAAILLVALGAPVGAASATAATSEHKEAQPGAAVGREQQQEALDASAARLERAAREAGPGFAGLVISPDENFLTLYWAGVHPPRLVRAIEEERGSGIDARLRSAKYALDQLLAAQARVVADGAQYEAGVVSTAPAIDGSGLILGHTGSEEAVLALASVRSISVPVILQRQEPIKPATRWRDLTPFSGGAAITSLTEGYYCSTAFAVKRPDGDRFMLTAAHCPSIGDISSENWITAGGGVPYGFTNINRWSEVNDTAWIDEPNVLSAYGPNVYMGGTDLTGVGTGERTSKIVGTTPNYNGDYVCTSGAFSGERCSIKVLNNQTTWNFWGPDYRWWTIAGVQAYRTDGGNAAGQGDSGGPVVKKSGSAYAYAQGVISAVQYQVRCTGVETFLGSQRYCGNYVYYGDINRIMSDVNFSIVTTTP